jgi:multiple sugar transport system permease protein
MGGSDSQRGGVPRHKTLKPDLLPYILVAPAFILMIIFFFYPFASNLYNSFMSEATFTRPPRFVGLANYRYILSSPTFHQALYNTFIWTIGVTILQFSLGLITALLLNTKVSIMKVIRPLYILPWATPGIVTALAWRWMYNADYGILNSLLVQLGIMDKYHGWLVEPSTAMLSVMAVGVWKGFPFYMLMLFAGLQGIPEELFEAAKIDGANGLQIFRHISLPQLRPILVMSLTLGLIWTSNYFDAIYVLTGGGPARMTETLPLFIYNTAFAYFRMHDAAVPSIVLFTLVMIFGALYMGLMKRGEGATK